MLADVIASAPSIASMMSDLITPILDERDTIRDHLTLNGWLTTLPTHTATTDMLCTDGALTASPLAIGDHYATLAVAVGYTNGNLDLTAHRAWSTFVPHSTAADKLASAIMLASEITLAAQTSPTTLVVLDGSHTTALTAITDVLSNTNKETLDRLFTEFDQRTLYDTITTIMTAPNIVAQQKQDSATNLWDALAGTGMHLSGTGLPDKPLASLILEPGEMLTHPACTPSWVNAATHLANAHPGTLRGALKDLCEPIANDNLIHVAHIKPYDAQFALRVEYKRDLPGPQRDDYFAALGADTHAPHTQEPLIQYLADKLAKDVSAASTLQLESARIEAGLSGHADLITYVLHYYRT